MYWRALRLPIPLHGLLHPPAEDDCATLHNQAVYLQVGTVTALQHLAGLYNHYYEISAAFISPSDLSA